MATSLVAAAEVVSAFVFFWSTSAVLRSIVNGERSAGLVLLAAVALTFSMGLELLRERFAQQAAHQLRVALTKRQLDRTARSAVLDLDRIEGVRGPNAEAALLGVGRLAKQHGVGLAGALAVALVVGVPLAALLIGVRLMARAIFWHVTIGGVVGRSAGVAPEVRRLNHLGTLSLEPRLHRELAVFGSFRWIRDLYESTWRSLGVGSPISGSLVPILAVGMSAAMIGLDALILTRVGDVSGDGQLAFELALLLQGLIATYNLTQVGQPDYFIEYGTDGIDELKLWSNEAPRVPSVPTRPWSTLELSSVNVQYPDRPTDALSDVSVSIESQDVIAITGESGEGKTTLLAVLTGVLQPSSGTRLVDGVTPVWPAFAMLLDDPARLPLSPVENVWPAGLDAAERAWLMRTLPLSSGVQESLMATSTPGQTAGLSGGEWQQLGLCRTLLEARRSGTPLALDEPTSNLAFELQSALMESLIVACRDHRLGCVFVTHNADLVRLANFELRVAGGRVDSIRVPGIGA